MVTRRVSEDLLATAKSLLTRRVTSSSLRFAVKVSAIRLAPKRLSNAAREVEAPSETCFYNIQPKVNPTLLFNSIANLTMRSNSVPRSV